MSIAQNILKLAKTLLADSPGLDGMSNREARKFVNYLLGKHINGFFKDNYWTPIHKTFKELNKHSINYDIKSSNYQKNDDGVPISKRWLFTVDFINERGRKTKLSGRMVASGAGSVDDPLSRYDVVAYIG